MFSRLRILSLWDDFGFDIYYFRPILASHMTRNYIEKISRFKLPWRSRNNTIMDDSERQRLEKNAQRDSYFEQRKTNDDEVKLYKGRS